MKPDQCCPWPPWVVKVLSILFVAMMIMVVFDRAAEKLLSATSWVFLGFAALADWRGGKRRIEIWLALMTLVLVPVGLMTGGSGISEDMIKYFLKYQVGIIWLAIAWLGAPAFSRSHMMERTWIAAVTALAMTMAWWATLSASASLFPKDSMKLLGSEILSYAGLFIVVVRSAACVKMPEWALAARASWLVVVVASISMAMVAITGLLWPHLGDAFLKMDFYRIDSDAPGTRRLQFLFYHHNRAGFFAACAVFICLAGAWGRRWWRRLGIAASACAAVALPFTLTRGALFAAAAGILLFILVGLLRRRRGRWGMLAVALIMVPTLWLGLPDKYQGHIEKAFNLENYNEGAGGSIGARFIMWDTARQLIVERPVLGFGYGFENFESAARLEHPEIPEYFKDAVHAHNMWLETAAEVGILGALLLALFTLVRLGGLTAAWWRMVRSRHPMAWLLLLWMCLELVILIYGITNYTLRRNLGFMTYAIWAGSVVLVIRFTGDLQLRCVKTTSEI